MNHYSELLYYLKSVFESDSFVSTITQGEFEDIDLNKKDIYPLVHFIVGDAQFNSEQTVSFNVQVGAFTQRDTNTETVSDKFALQDNLIDNLNEMLAVLNRGWLIIQRDFDEKNIYVTSNPTCEKVVDGFENRLDGWIMTFDVELPNTIISLC